MNRCKVLPFSYIFESRILNVLLCFLHRLFFCMPSTHELLFESFELVGCRFTLPGLCFVIVVKVVSLLAGMSA